MPRPLYVICSESGAEDRDTGLVSLFKIIDKLQLHKTPPQKQPPLTQIRITSQWMKESGDDGHEFEFEIALRPPHGEEIKAGTGTFSFALPLFRVVATLIGPLPVQGEGILWVECRVRRIGAKGWKTHETPIFIEQLPAAGSMESAIASPATESSETTVSPTQN